MLRIAENTGRAATLGPTLAASLAGLSFTMQTFVEDPQGPLGYANSNGGHVIVN